jgi:hypothetical protein
MENNWPLIFKPAFKKIHSFKELFFLYLQYEIKTNYQSNYNDYGYYNFNGNILHILSHIIAINENVDGILDYINFLYFLCKIKKINKNQKNIDDETPFDIYKKDTITEKWFLSINLILNYPLYTIEKIQALIRGFLCRRRLYKNKYNQCINDIIFAPSNYFINSFIGGIEFHKFIEKSVNKNLF